MYLDRQPGTTPGNKGRAKAPRPQVLTRAGYCQEIELPLLLQKKKHCKRTDQSQSQTCAYGSGCTCKGLLRHQSRCTVDTLVLAHNSAERQREWMAFLLVLGWSELRGLRGLSVKLLLYLGKSHGLSRLHQMA